jgi:subtilisin family serine protease
MRSLLCLLLLFAPSWAQEFAPDRFIVELAGPPAVQPATRSARRASIAGEQGALERALSARGLRVQASVDTVANALIVEAPDEAALAGLPGVKKVHRVRLHKPVLLEHELDIHKVRDAWSQLGGDSKAGAGVKIAILDSGIDVSHPAFNQPDLEAPEGYPKYDRESNRIYTSRKIVVARSYDGRDALDRDGHGTAVASVAAAAPHNSVAGFFSGVAPRAWLGAYRVTDFEGYYPSDYVLRALDDAVKDGMDVINMSFGSVGVGVPDELALQAFDRCMENGIILVRSAGNTPGAMTVDDDASYPRVIAVGATQNSRLTTTPAVVPSQGASIPAGTSSNSAGSPPISGPLFDVARGDDANGLGCAPLPEGTLAGKIPIIRRGTCFFWEKLRNAQLAGAKGAIIYNSPAPADGSPEDVINMDVSEASQPVSIPGLFIGNSNGRRLLEALKANEDFSVQLRFGDVPNESRLLTSFTSYGPGVSLWIKPDLVAVGSLVTAAVPTGFCDLCASSGYVRISGTSFSSPYTAGAAAVLKAARKNLTVDEYRSLLVNSTTSLDLEGSPSVPVMAGGSGLLNLQNALESTLAAAPVSLSFSSGGSTIEKTSRLALKNLSAEPVTLTLAVESANEAKASLNPGSLTLAGGETANVDVELRASGLADGVYQGFVVARNTLNGVATRVPYWYAAKTADVPASIVIVDVDETVAMGSTGRALVRTHNSAGLALGDLEPRVTPLTDGAEVVSVVRSSFPNTWRVTVRPGRQGTNSFRVEAGTISRTFSLQGR